MAPKDFIPVYTREQYADLLVTRESRRRQMMMLSTAVGVAVGAASMASSAAIGWRLAWSAVALLPIARFIYPSEDIRRLIDVVPPRVRIEMPGGAMRTIDTTGALSD